MPGWQLVAHRGTHLLLYVLFFAVPLLGWAYSSALGVPIVWFGVLPLPDFVPLDKEFAEAVLKPLHQASAFTLAAVVVLHAAAALKHQFVDRDGLLDRMCRSRPEAHASRGTPSLRSVRRCVPAAWPWRSRRSPAPPSRWRSWCPAKPDRVRHQADGRAGRRRVQEVRRPDRLRPAKARGRQGGAADRHRAAPPSACRRAMPSCPRRRGSTPPAFRRPSFQSSAIKAWAAGASRSPASSTIKGTHPGTRGAGDDHAIGRRQSMATGSFTIQRLAFKIGEGEWTDTSMVGRRSAGALQARPDGPASDLKSAFRSSHTSPFESSS